MVEVKMILVAIRSIGGTAELHFEDVNSGRRWTHCVLRSMCITDDVIREARIEATIGIEHILAQKPITATDTKESMRNIKLRQAFRKYGAHLPRCVSVGFGDRCNCGFEQVVDL